MALKMPVEGTDKPQKLLAMDEQKHQGASKTHLRTQRTQLVRLQLIQSLRYRIYHYLRDMPS